MTKSAFSIATELLGQSPRNQESNKITLPRKDPRTHEIGKTQASTERMAHWLADKFNSPDYMPALLKIAWALPDATLHRLVGQTLERAPSNPRAYFIACAKNEMKKRDASSSDSGEAHNKSVDTPRLSTFQHLHSRRGVSSFPRSTLPLTQTS